MGGPFPRARLVWSLSSLGPSTPGLVGCWYLVSLRPEPCRNRYKYSTDRMRLCGHRNISDTRRPIRASHTSPSRASTSLNTTIFDISILRGPPRWGTAILLARLAAGDDSQRKRGWARPIYPPSRPLFYCDGFDGNMGICRCGHACERGSVYFPLPWERATAWPSMLVHANHVAGGVRCGWFGE